MEPAGVSMNRIGLLLMAFMTAVSGAGLEPVASIAMPNVKGRIDHFGVDVKGHRLFVAALGNDTVEVIDTAKNRHERSISGFGEPQGLFYLPEKQLLYVANGSSNRLDVLDARSFAATRRVEALDDADNVRYDAAARAVIVGYGKGGLRLLDSESGNSKGDVKLSGHPESFQLERAGTRIFVNVPTSRQIAVVDRAKSAVVAMWPVSARHNYPMALDDEGKRLFVGARFPSVLLAYDTDSGKQVAKVDICGDTDDLFFDAERKRVYVICGEGQVDVFRQEGPDRYVLDGSVNTAPRARTGLFVPEERKLYVAAPAVNGAQARILVYTAR